MRIRTALAPLALATSLAAPVAAQDKPIQLALVNPVQLVPEGQGISVVRLNLIYSVNRSVNGLDVGLVNVTSGGASSGVQWAVASVNRGAFTGWQGGWGGFGAVAAITEGPFVGLQSALYTSARQGRGVQIGLLNTAASWNGLQFGLLNLAQQLHGVQIGLINVIKTGGQFPVFPIVNWSF